ncbi:MAG: (4Fe-4S)-binding protein [Thiobacillus sp.]|nr:(4Fe-4S)-binding protein [Thiobacillus sp.]
MKVIWDEKACCHSGNCVKTLPQVFKVEGGKFVIQPENATEEQVRQVVAACPAKAFQME